MNKPLWLLLLVLIVPMAALAQGGSANKRAIDHGRFLVNYGGCQDCHTPGWGENGGKAPKDQLLTGSGMNFQGPWGTTYPPNLRLYVQSLTVKEWIANLRTLKTRPLMPAWAFSYLSDKDLADMYTYIHSLGPAGQPAHAYVPPGQDAPGPYMKLILPPAPAAAKAEHN